MISTRKLIRMAREWQRKAANGRKRISFPKNRGNGTVSTSSSSSALPEKGNFVLYTADQKRYSFPIAYLNNYFFRELFRMSEEEFGLPSNGPITVPCEAIFIDYLISVMQRSATIDIEKALLVSISGFRCSSSCMVDQLEITQQSQIHCF